MRQKRSTIASFQQGFYFSSAIISSFKNFQVIFTSHVYKLYIPQN